MWRHCRGFQRTRAVKWLSVLGTFCVWLGKQLAVFIIDVSNYMTTSWNGKDIRITVPLNIIKGTHSLPVGVLLTKSHQHYNDVIINVMASQTTSLTIVYSTVCSGADQRKHQSSASLAFVRGIHRWTVSSLHTGPVTWKMFPFDDVIINAELLCFVGSMNKQSSCKWFELPWHKGDVDKM